MAGRLVVRLAAVGLAAAAACTAGAGAVRAAPPAGRPAPPVQRHTAGVGFTGIDFTGIVALDGCSGSLVRGPRSRPADPALVLTNGHCLAAGMPAAGEAVVDRPSARTFTLLDASGRGDLGTLRAVSVEYATMTGTDVAVYRLRSSYADIQRRYGVSAPVLSTEPPADGTEIRVVSGYWRRIYSCEIDGTVHRLREAQWTWKNSMRYTSGCRTVDGTSGSPVLDARTGRVVGVNNTANEDGGRCTLDNPCEVARNGEVTVRPGAGYAQQTYVLARCLGPRSDVVVGGSCGLPEPAAS